MTHEEMLEKVDLLYDGRTSGDTSKFAAVLAPGASFTFAGEETLVAKFPGGSSSDPENVAKALFDAIEMADRKRLTSIADDHRIAVLFQTKLRVKGGEKFDQLLFDLWEFDEQGRITKGTQFQDTAKILEQMSAAEGGAQNAA